ncbi:hypothetical protein C8F04DRAFT_417681 [Mycena alexandri]|uniref:Uncharacterized protein n=1 Tax=Mycena alexandri TaxID=1745969 RepID=A0AAD6WMD7_9AGAR|nr:hypothetical protein C8F04DRAFT_417681 [Mycena alexandri]
MLLRIFDGLVSRRIASFQAIDFGVCASSISTHYKLRTTLVLSGPGQICLHMCYSSSSRPHFGLTPTRGLVCAASLDTAVLQYSSLSNLCVHVASSAACESREGGISSVSGCSRSIGIVEGTLGWDTVWEDLGAMFRSCGLSTSFVVPDPPPAVSFLHAKTAEASWRSGATGYPCNLRGPEHPRRACDGGARGGERGRRKDGREMDSTREDDANEATQRFVRARPPPPISHRFVYMDGKTRGRSSSMQQSAAHEV